MTMCVIREVAGSVSGCELGFLTQRMTGKDFLTGLQGLILHSWRLSLARDPPPGTASPAALLKAAAESGGPLLDPMEGPACVCHLEMHTPLPGTLSTNPEGSRSHPAGGTPREDRPGPG